MNGKSVGFDKTDYVKRVKVKERRRKGIKKDEGAVKIDVRVSELNKRWKGGTVAGIKRGKRGTDRKGGHCILKLGRVGRHERKIINVGRGENIP